MGSEVPDAIKSDQPLLDTGSRYSLQHIISKFNPNDGQVQYSVGYDYSKSFPDQVEDFKKKLIPSCIMQFFMNSMVNSHFCI